MILKKGQQVQIKKGLEENKIYDDCAFVNPMTEYLGMKVIITGIHKMGLHTYYKLNVDNGHWDWSYSMLTLINTTWREHYKDIKK